MAQMIRKQIYIAPSQQALLKRLAKTRGASEAEIIRQAIEREASGVSPALNVSDASALAEIVVYALSRRQLGATAQPHTWNRDDIYAERLNRYGAEQASG